MEEKLKPCPFCGGEAELKQNVGYYAMVVEDGSICNTSGNVSHVRCKSCHCTTEMTFGIFDAVKRWNTRVGDSINPEACLILKDCHKCGGELTYFDTEGYCHKCKQPR